MKSIQKHLKPVAYALSFLILLQGCVAYKKTSNTLEEIAQTQLKVKVITKDGREQHFKKIIVIDCLYYGTKNKRINSKDFLIFPKDIFEVKIHDKKKSMRTNIITAGVFAGIIGALVYWVRDGIAVNLSN